MGGLANERKPVMTSSTTPPPVPRTERGNRASRQLDSLSSYEIVELLNREDAVVAEAVRPALPQLARLVDFASAALDSGGTVHYFGAGTSGRLAVLDAAELVPTFNLEVGTVVAHIAGGEPALLTAVEEVEDSAETGAAEAAGVQARDVVIGIAASGSTPYVIGALGAARAAGACTALITSNPDTSVAGQVDLVIAADTGPEVLTGSTRLKAGTAAKLLLNGFSTALMVRRGRVWSNFMVSLVAGNSKLRERSIRILAEAGELSQPDALRLLERADGDLKTALVSHLGAADMARARTALVEGNGTVSGALAALRREQPFDAISISKGNK